MKSIIAVLCLLVILAVPGFAQDGKETLTLKRDLAQERVMRIQAELSLLKVQFRDGQEALKQAMKILDDVNASLKAMKAEKETGSTQ